MNSKCRTQNKRKCGSTSFAFVLLYFQHAGVCGVTGYSSGWNQDDVNRDVRAFSLLFLLSAKTLTRGPATSGPATSGPTTRAAAMTEESASYSTRLVQPGLEPTGQKYAVCFHQTSTIHVESTCRQDVPTEHIH